MRAKEFINEAVLDPTGWGSTPYGTDIDYFGLRVQMKPSTFLELALPLGQAETNPDVEKHMSGGGSRMAEAASPVQQSAIAVNIKKAGKNPKRVAESSPSEDYVEEAEEDTEESNLIVKSLKKAGYKMLGSGADATVWIKDQGTVTKIIMPDIKKGSAEYRDMGAAIFKKFFDFCSQHQDIECLPKFYPVQGHRYLEFELGGKSYIQTDMEQLYPIKKNTFAEGMAYALSELVDQNLSWEEMYELLKVPATWHKLKMQSHASRFSLKAMNLTRIEQARYSVLFTMMKFLYLTGRINRFGWDLHTENIMQRKDGTLVITDPWFEIQKDS